MSRRYTRVVTTPAAARLPHGPSHAFVSLTSDWGVRDPSPSIARGVVLGIAPQAHIVDISHEVEKYNIRHGALMLWCALPYLPLGAHMAVIDPGVGTSRRPIAIETARGDYLVGPDNGLLLPGAERLGGVRRAHVIENPQYRLPIVSTTFHGRDLFAPATAHLAVGVPLDAIGPRIDVADLVALEDWPGVEHTDGELSTTVIYRDTFGNLKLSAVTSDLHEAFPGVVHGDRFNLRVARARGKGVVVPWVRTFGEVGRSEHLLYEDSYGRLCLAQNQGNAGESLGIGEGAIVRVTRAATSGRSAGSGSASRRGQSAE